MTRQKLNITFHNPNCPDTLADILIKLSAQVAAEKVRREILLLNPSAEQQELA